MLSIGKNYLSNVSAARTYRRTNWSFASDRHSSPR